METSIPRFRLERTHASIRKVMFDMDVMSVVTIVSFKILENVSSLMTIPMVISYQKKTYFKNWNRTVCEYKRNLCYLKLTKNVPTGNEVLSPYD